MFRKLKLVLLGTMLTVAAMFATAAPVSAAYTGNLAGKPCISDKTNLTGCDWTKSCSAGPYGKVNGQIVLFAPWHCIGNPGMNVYGPNGILLGPVAANYADIFSSDMAFIWLGGSGNHPTSGLNLVYSAPNNDPWTITSQYGSSSTSCTNLAAGTLSGDFEAKVTYWWHTSFSPFGATQWGSVPGSYVISDGPGYYGVGQRCHVFTTVPYTGSSSSPYSGSVWMTDSYPGTVLGNTTGHGVIGGSDKSYFTSWYQAIRDLNTYASGGAFFCSNSSCT